MQSVRLNLTERSGEKFCATMLRCFTLLFYLLVCCILTDITTASKPLSILLIEPLPSVSHHVWSVHLIKGLLRQGHHVHVVSIQETKVEKKLAENLTYAVFDGLMSDEGDYESYNQAESTQYSVLYTTYYVYKLCIEACDKVTKSKAGKELLEMIKDVEFDVIVQDITLYQCLFGLREVAKGKPPLVGYLPYGSAPWFKDYVGGPGYPTVRPYTHSAIAKPEGLWLKTWNTLYYIVDDLMRYYYYVPNIQRVHEEYMGRIINSLHDIEQDNVNIVLINSHSAFEFAIPLPPNALEVAGLSAQTVQPLPGEVVVTYPEDMRAFLDGAKNGAIAISLGTNVKWKSIGMNKIESVIQAVSKLKQRVLWKLDIEVPFEKPDNLMIVKWMPQNEVLSHKNVRAIWTHGGLLSTHEAIWKGVPMIIMPFFVDQKSNAEILVAKGVGIYLNINTLSTQAVLHAIKEILYNESYTRNMEQLSSEFRDRPMPPIDLAVWSIEYAVRHPNGTLISPLKYQSWIEQNLIDVYAVLFSILIIILLSIFFTIKIVINFCCNCKTSKLRKNKHD